MAEPNLKPCPFCGGKARASSYHAGEGLTQTYVSCTGCFAQTDVVEAPYSEPSRAAVLWNQRAPDPEATHAD